jgi:hypothetical protein
MYLTYKIGGFGTLTIVLLKPNDNMIIQLSRLIVITVQVGNIMNFLEIFYQIVNAPLAFVQPATLRVCLDSVIIWLLLSAIDWHKVITLNGFNNIQKMFIASMSHVFA